LVLRKKMSGVSSKQKTQLVVTAEDDNLISFHPDESEQHLFDSVDEEGDDSQHRFDRSFSERRSNWHGA